MDWTTLASLIARHGLTTLGGYLTAYGLLPDGTSVDQFVGPGMVLVGVAWSWWQKTGHASVIAEMESSLEYWKARGTGRQPPPGAAPGPAPKS
jgi:hypothetical protein